MTVFDIGANFGWYTVLMSKEVGLNGKVHCFEPEKSVYENLRYNVTNLNDIRHQVTYNNVALTNTEGMRKLYIPIIDGEPASPAASMQKIKSYKSEFLVKDCSVLTLDSYCKKNGISRIDFIKCDVEGGEMEVLKGGTAIFESSPKPTMLIEINGNCEYYGHTIDDVLEYLYLLDYKVWAINPNGSLSDPTDSDDGINYLCVDKSCSQMIDDSFKSELKKAAKEI